MDSKSNGNTRSIEPVKDFQSHLFCERVATTKLTGVQARVAFVLLKHSNGKGTCWPGNERIAETLGHGDPGHVRDALQLLERHGLIERVKQGRTRGFRLIGGGPLQAQAQGSEVAHLGGPLRTPEPGPVEAHPR